MCLETVILKESVAFNFYTFKIFLQLFKMKLHFSPCLMQPFFLRECKTFGTYCNFK